MSGPELTPLRSKPVSVGDRLVIEQVRVICRNTGRFSVLHWRRVLLGESFGGVITHVKQPDWPGKRMRFRWKAKRPLPAPLSGSPSASTTLGACGRGLEDIGGPEAYARFLSSPDGADFNGIFRLADAAAISPLAFQKLTVFAVCLDFLRSTLRFVCRASSSARLKSSASFLSACAKVRTMGKSMVCIKRTH